MRKRNKGFTLVELLVVMAIIAILASIVVPNLATWIQRGRVTKAVSEIKSVELALSAMLADTERSGLSELYDPDGVELVLNTQNIFNNYINGLLQQPYNPNNPTHRMEAAKKLYTNTTTAMLVAGRGVLQESLPGVPSAGRDPELDFLYSNVLTVNLVKRLGTNYLPELQFDPWNELYNIFPGPWRTSNGPNIFRSYLSAAGGAQLPGTGGASSQDGLTFSVQDPETGITENVSFPANTRKPFYIWSSGANTVSGQALYNPGGYGPPGQDAQTKTAFFLDQELHLMGGGDDINNWDGGSGWGRFYN